MSRWVLGCGAWSDLVWVCDGDIWECGRLWGELCSMGRRDALEEATKVRALLGDLYNERKENRSSKEWTQTTTQFSRIDEEARFLYGRRTAEEHRKHAIIRTGKPPAIGRHAVYHLRYILFHVQQIVDFSESGNGAPKKEPRLSRLGKVYEHSHTRSV